VLTLRLSLPRESYPEPEDVVRFYGELQDRLRTLPGISEAGAVRGLPLSGVIGDWSIWIEGRPPVPGNNPKGDWQVVSPGYFEAMGMELVKGRFFDKGDRSGAREVAMINETMARMYWPDEDPIGQRFQMGTRGGRPWITIIGVVGDVVHNGLTVAVNEKFYRPHAQFHHSTNFSPRSMTFVIQTSSEPMGLVSSVRREIRAMDSNLPIAEIRTLDNVLENAISEPRFTTFLLGVFAAVALLLAAIGIYGVMSYSVSQRTHEIGIRMALGAGRGRVLGMVLKRGVGLTVLGSAVGVGMALWLTRWMTSLLFGVGARDLETFLAVPSVLFLVALFASYVPSRRATQVHPVKALRME
jgi:putative ABC transport system permease protein